MNSNMNPNDVIGSQPLLAVLILFVALWTITLKGFALYRAGSNKDKGWFVALFILNTLGILELIYLLVISKKRSN